MHKKKHYVHILDLLCRCELRVTNYELRMWNYFNYELRVTNYELVGFADFECIIWQQSTGSDVGIPHEKAEKHASFFDYIESQPLVEQRDTKCCMSEASSLSN